MKPTDPLDMVYQKIVDALPQDAEPFVVVQALAMATLNVLIHNTRNKVARIEAGDFLAAKFRRAVREIPPFREVAAMH